MGMIIPKGAERILQARRNGKKPSDLIIISMVGPLPNELNPVVQVDAKKDYDWQWAKDLIVCFWTDPKNYSSKQILACAKLKPKRILLWNCAQEKGYEIGALPRVDSIVNHQAKWVWEVHQIPWTSKQEKEFAMGIPQWT